MKNCLLLGALVMMGATFVCQAGGIGETALWQGRIDAAAARGGGTVSVPSGRHLVGELQLKSNVRLHLEKGAVLEGAVGLEHYRNLRLPFSEGTWSAVVSACGVTNVSITGEGEIFGNGKAWNPAKGARDAMGCTEGLRPRGLFFSDCAKVRLEGFLLRDAACWGIVFKRCVGVVAKNVKIDSCVNLNNDGFDIEARDVLIEGCDVNCGDDALCLKSNDPNFVVENVTVRDCVARTHCSAIKFGTASHGTMRKVRFERIRIEAPRRVYRDLAPMPTDFLTPPPRIAGAPAYLTGAGIGAICVECVDGGIVEDVTVDGVTLSGFRVPIFIRGGTRKGRTCGIPPNDKHVLRNILIQNVTGRAESRLVSSITGVPGCRPQNITLRNVSLECIGEGENKKPVREPGNELDGSYPEATMFGRYRLPAYGLYVSQADDVKLENVNFTLRKGTTDTRPAHNLRPKAVELKNGAEFELATLPAEATAKLAKGGTIRFLLEENATTGYEWTADYSAGEVDVTIEHRAAAANGLAGAAGRASVIARLKGDDAAPVFIEMRYRRRWEKGAPAKAMRVVLYKVKGGIASSNYPRSRTLEFLQSECANRGIVITDWHVHIRGGMTPERAAERERLSGIRSSAMENHGREWEIFTNERLRRFAADAKKVEVNGHRLPVGIQVNDRDWFRQIDAETRAQFDFILADTMIMGKLANGRDKRLWLVRDISELGDPEKWMEEYMQMNLQILDEPISILANPTYLPAPLNAMADRLWTPERMKKIIEKAVARGIAIEIQAESPYPRPAFLKLARKMGAKFSFGTNNYDAAPKDLSRWLEAITWLDLHGEDIWQPSMLKQPEPAAQPTLECPAAGSWQIRLDREEGECGAGVETWRVTLASPKPAQPPRFTLAFEKPQVDAHHKWTPATERVTMPPNWSSTTSSRLASSLPVVAFLNDADRNRQCVSVSEAGRQVKIDAGLKEEGSRLVWKIAFFGESEAPISSYSVKVRIDTRDVFFGDAIREGVAWIEGAAGLKPAVPPADAFAPLYSSWYSFHQDVTDKALEAECAEAARLGMKVLIVDDGWQTDDTNRGYAYCGDWQISKRRFPDMAAHVKRVQKMGLKYMMWYSVPFVGYKSANYARFKGKYLYNIDGLGCSVLDPRFPEVRAFLGDIYAKAIKEWGLDGFKLDFIDSIGFRGADPAVKENYAGRDVRLLSAAVDLLLRDITARVKAVKPEALIEFRQSYVGPAIRQYGNMIRAADCPGDLLANRARTANLRLTSGGSAVHADMLEWNVNETAEDAARYVLSVMFSTIQYSMMLRDIPPAHKRMIAHWIGFSQKHRGALLHGAFRPHQYASFYPWIEGEDANELVIGVYQNGQSVPLASPKRVLVMNGTAEGRLLVESTAARTGVAFDTFGDRVGEVAVSKGLNAVSVPKGGYVAFEAEAKGAAK